MFAYLGTAISTFLLAAFIAPAVADEHGPTASLPQVRVCLKEEAVTDTARSEESANVQQGDGQEKGKDPREKQGPLLSDSGNYLYMVDENHDPKIDSTSALLVIATEDVDDIKVGPSRELAG